MAAQPAAAHAALPNVFGAPGPETAGGRPEHWLRATAQGRWYDHAEWCIDDLAACARQQARRIDSLEQSRQDLQRVQQEQAEEWCVLAQLHAQQLGQEQQARQQLTIDLKQARQQLADALQMCEGLNTHMTRLESDLSSAGAVPAALTYYSGSAPGAAGAAAGTAPACTSSSSHAPAAPAAPAKAPPPAPAPPQHMHMIDPKHWVLPKALNPLHVPHAQPGCRHNSRLFIRNSSLAARSWMGSAVDVKRWNAGTGKDTLWSFCSSLGSSFDVDDTVLYNYLTATPSIHLGVHNPKADNYNVMFACSVCGRHTEEFKPRFMAILHGVALPKNDERVKHAFREIISTCLTYDLDDVTWTYDAPATLSRWHATSSGPIRTRPKEQLRALTDSAV